MTDTPIENGRSASWLSRRLCGGRQRFYAAAGIVVGLALIFSVVVNVWLQNKSAAHRDANDFLKRELGELDQQIGEIKLFREQIYQLLARMRVVEVLNETRAKHVDTINFLARNIPKGVQITRAAANGLKELELDGLARSGAEVSALIRAIKRSPLLERPLLVSISEYESDRRGLQRFRIAAQFKRDSQDARAPGGQAGKAESSPQQVSGKEASGLPATRGDGSAFAYGVIGYLAGGFAVALTLFGIRRWRQRRRVADRQRPSFFRRFASEFDTLDPGNLPSWGAVPRLAVLLEIGVIALVAAWVGLIDPAIEELENLQTESAKMKEEWLSKKRVAVNLDTYRQQLAEADRMFGALFRMLPYTFDVAQFSSDLHQLAGRRGVLIEELQPRSESQKDFYSELPVSVALTGTFDSIGAVIADLAGMHLVSTLSTFTLTPTETGASKGKDMNLRLQGRIAIFRYLDDEEISQIKKKKAKAK